MSQQIPLQSKDVRATVSSFGAWLTEFYIEKQHVRTDILYPKREIPVPGGKPKIRGGVHICYPNFGPDERSGSLKFAQHGIARILPWAIMHQTDDSISLHLTVDGNAVERLSPSQPGIQECIGLSGTLTYRICSAPSPRLEAFLDVENRGTHMMRVAPGFHPYFQLHSGLNASDVVISGLNDGDKRVGNANPSYDEHFPGEGIRFSTGNGTDIKIAGQAMNTVTFWSDDPDNFVCVEPTYAGPSFTALAPIQNDEMLAPGTTRHYGMVITASE